MKILKQSSDGIGKWKLHPEIEDDESAIREVVELLRPEGVFIYPKPTDAAKYIDSKYTAIENLTTDELLDWMQRNGLSIKMFNTYGGSYTLWVCSWTYKEESYDAGGLSFKEAILSCLRQSDIHSIRQFLVIK